MIGLVLVTHGRLAAEFLAAMEHVVGPQAHGARGMHRRRRRHRAAPRGIVDAIERSTTGSGVVILTDMFGGTPSNLAISTMDRKGIEVIAGVNLPMLIKLASVRADRAAARCRRRGPGGRTQIHQRGQPAAQRRPRPDRAARATIVQPARPACPRGRQVRARPPTVSTAQSGRPATIRAWPGTSILGLMLLGAGDGHRADAAGRRHRCRTPPLTRSGRPDRARLRRIGGARPDDPALLHRGSCALGGARARWSGTRRPHRISSERAIEEP